MDDFFKKHGLRLLPDHASREQGNLNKVYFVEDQAGEKCVLRFHRQDNRADIESYIDNQIKCLGAANLGARLCYRSMEDQAEFMKRLADRGVFVPQVKDHGPDWMLMEFVAGQSLKDTLPDLEGEKAGRFITRILDAFIQVHEKGECLWDRWGGNELVDSEGQVCFIDFDINIDWPEEVPVKIRAGFDLAFMLRGCIQFSKDKEAAAETIAAFIRHYESFDSIYDVKALQRFLKGQVDFYKAEYCQNPIASAEDKEKHTVINQGIEKINEEIGKNFRSRRPDARPSGPQH